MQIARTLQYKTYGTGSTGHGLASQARASSPFDAATGQARPPLGLAPGSPVEVLSDLHCPGMLHGRSAGIAVLRRNNADESSVIQAVMPTVNASEEVKLGFLALMISYDVRDLLVVRDGASSRQSGTRVDDSFLDELHERAQGRQWSFETRHRQRVDVRASVLAEGRELAPELQVNWEVPGRHRFHERIRFHDVELNGRQAEKQRALDSFFHCREVNPKGAGERPESVVIVDAPGVLGGASEAVILVNEWFAQRESSRRGEARVRPPWPSGDRAHPALRRV